MKAIEFPAFFADDLLFKMQGDPRVLQYNMLRTAAPVLTEALSGPAWAVFGLAKDGVIVSARVNGSNILAPIHGEGEIRRLELRERFWHLVFIAVTFGIWLAWLVARFRGRSR